MIEYTAGIYAHQIEVGCVARLREERKEKMARITRSYLSGRLYTFLDYFIYAPARK